MVSCPYCRRQYALKTDRASISPGARATCGRCGKSFELLTRIVVPGAPPPLPRKAPPPLPRDSRLASSPLIPVVTEPREPPVDADLSQITQDILRSAEQLEPELPTVDLPPSRAPATPPPLPPAEASSPALPAISEVVAPPSPSFEIQAEPESEAEAEAASVAAAESVSASVSASESVAAAESASGSVSPAEAEPAAASPALPAAIVAPGPDPTQFVAWADPGLEGLVEEPRPSAQALEHLLR